MTSQTGDFSLLDFSIHLDNDRKIFGNRTGMTEAGIN
jgi:hypothetical protein